jgi:hypothetical protein
MNSLFENTFCYQNFGRTILINQTVSSNLSEREESGFILSLPKAPSEAAEAMRELPPSSAQPDQLRLCEDGIVSTSTVDLCTQTSLLRGWSDSSQMKMLL